MRFDWYQGTVRGDAARVRDMLCGGLGDETREADGLARFYRYERGVSVWDGGAGPVASVFWGGQAGTVHAVASGEHTEALARLLRAECPEHWVTRADAAQDFREWGAYDRIRPALRTVAERYRVSFARIEDELDLVAGRTQYVGSARSDCRVRLYEKGLHVAGELRRSLGARFAGADVGRVLNAATGEYVEPGEWVRLEAQVRPPDEVGKRWLASAEPSEVWGCSPWLSEVAEGVLGLDVPRFVMTRRKRTALQDSIRAMLRQYGGKLAELAEREGVGWGSSRSVGGLLRKEWEAMQKERASGMMG